MSSNICMQQGYLRYPMTCSGPQSEQQTCEQCSFWPSPLFMNQPACITHFQECVGAGLPLTNTKGKNAHQRQLQRERGEYQLTRAKSKLKAADTTTMVSA